MTLVGYEAAVWADWRLEVSLVRRRQGGGREEAEAEEAAAGLAVGSPRESRALALECQQEMAASMELAKSAT